MLEREIISKGNKCLHKGRLLAINLAVNLDVGWLYCRCKLEMSIQLRPPPSLQPTVSQHRGGGWDVRLILFVCAYSRPADAGVTFCLHSSRSPRQSPLYYCKPRPRGLARDDDKRLSSSCGGRHCSGGSNNSTIIQGRTVRGGPLHYGSGGAVGPTLTDVTGQCWNYHAVKHRNAEGRGGGGGSNRLGGLKI